jgi:hypothetical protein
MKKLGKVVKIMVDGDYRAVFYQDDNGAIEGIASYGLQVSDGEPYIEVADLKVGDLLYEGEAADNG